MPSTLVFCQSQSAPFLPSYSASFNSYFKPLFVRLLLEEHVSEAAFFRSFRSYLYVLSSLLSAFRFAPRFKSSILTVSMLFLFVVISSDACL